MLIISVNTRRKKINHAAKQIISSLVNCNFAASLNFAAGSRTKELWKHLLNNIIKINPLQYLGNKRRGIFEFVISQFAAALHSSFYPVMLSNVVFKALVMTLK